MAFDCRGFGHATLPPVFLSIQDNQTVMSPSFYGHAGDDRQSLKIIEPQLNDAPYLKDFVKIRLGVRRLYSNHWRHALLSTQVEAQHHSRLAVVWPHILMALAAFSALRIALLVKVWPEVSHTVWNGIYIFTLGLFYDLAFISYFCIPFVLFLLFLPDKLYHSRVNRYATYAMSLAVLYGLYFSCTAEWLFWEEFGTRFNFISVDYLVYRHEVAQNIYESYPLIPILMVLLLAAVLTFVLIRKPLAGALQAVEPFRRRLGWAVPFFIAPVVTVLLVGQSLRTLSPNNYVNELASNGPYQFVAAFRNNKLDYKAFYRQGDDTTLSSLLRDHLRQAHQKFHDAHIYDIRRRIAPQGPPQRLNVILITVESLSAKYLKRFGSSSGDTPFMDRWFQQGLLFTNCFATGTRTTRGLEAITLSLPPTPGRSVVKRPDNAHMFSLGKVLQDNGYDTAFIYGGRGFFDNMNAFFSGNGYRTVDQNDFKAGEISFKNAWGVADEDLYRKALQEADRTYRSGQPFFFHIMTTSNHRPYTYPEGKIAIPPGSGREGAVAYTDYALNLFMDLARVKPWYTDTLFVLVADHCAGSAGKVGLDHTKYHIPLLFFSPGRVAPGEIDQRCSQIDIAPTLLALLNIDYESYFFGEDMLTPDFRPRALIANYQKLGLLEDNNHLAMLSPGKKIELQIDDRLMPLDAASGLAQELMAYYQGADYILNHRLNRW
jgi:phosphoglycerol transferase MdoB-like AlkP superfamily enzyme